MVQWGCASFCRAEESEEENVSKRKIYGSAKTGLDFDFQESFQPTPTPGGSQEEEAHERNDGNQSIPDRG
jgi:hypothetical protein